MSEWETTTLGEFTTLQRGHDLPKQDRREGDVPILGSFGITGWHDESKVKGPGVTVGRSGASYGVVSYSECDFWPLNTALFVKDFHGNDERFAYYFLQSIDFKRFNSGSAVQSLNRNHVHPMEIRVPPLPEQRAIASILEALDDKIELNRRMNATLESLARAIFKSWFVDFDPVKINAGQMPASSAIPTTHDPKVLDLFPSTFQDSQLGPIPEGWNAKPLSDICELMSGGTPKKKIEEYWNGNLPWISPKAMNGIHVFESDSCVTEAAVGNGTRLVPAGTTLVMVRGMGLHQGVRISQAQRDVTFNQDVKALIPTTVDSTFLLYAMLNAAPILFGKVRAAGHGTGVLSTDIIKDLEFAIPPDGIFGRLTQPLKELNQEVHNNELEAQSLSALRDALLPKLLSGSIRLDNAQETKRVNACLLYTSPSPRDLSTSRMPSSA